MRTLKHIVLSVILAIALMAPCLAQSPPSGEIKGTVQGAAGELLAGVAVTAIKDGKRHSATTDGNGFYNLTSLEPGTYVVTFEKPGFKKITQRNVLVSPPQVTVASVKHMDISISGTLAGVISDGQGAVVPGAHVVATNSQTHETYETTTNADGQYSIATLPVGTYKVEAERPGFKKVVALGVQVLTSQLASFNIAMVVGSIDEAVMIGSEGVTIDVEKTNLSTSLSSSTLENLPSLSRNPYDLASLSPGAASSEGLNPNMTTVSINGQRPRANTVVVDGADVSPSSTNSQEVPYGALGEVVISSHDPAELGRFTGGVISITTKSGTNEFHGAATYFNRNSGLAARDFFETTRSRSLSHQFGFTLGGPVVRNHTFFFGGYEGKRRLEGRPRIASVPSPDLLRTARDILTSHGLVENSLSDRLLQLFPAPERAGNFNNRFTNSPAITNSDSFTFKLNQSVNHKVEASAKYNLGDLDDLSPSATSFFPGYRTWLSSRDQALLGTIDAVLSPVVTNGFFVLYRKNRERLLPEDSDFNPSSLGLITGATEENFGLPLITITGFDALGAPGGVPSRLVATTWQTRNKLAWIQGSHTLSFGVDFLSTFLDSNNGAGKRGRITFDGSFLGNPLADFLAGLPSGQTAILRGDTRLGATINSLDWFAQDLIRVKPNLFINVGIRYEYNGVVHDKQGRLSNFASDLGGLVQVGSQELPKLYENDGNHFAPRLGVSWSPGRSGRFVFKSSWGIYLESPSPYLFLYLCPCANSITQGVATNPIGSAPAFAVHPAPPVPFGSGTPLFGVGSAAPVDLFSVDRQLKTPYTQNFRFGFEYEFASRFVLRVDYVGAVARNLYRIRDINQPPPGDPASENLRRPFFSQFPQFRSINQLSATARSNFNALETSVRRRSNHGLTFEATYTFSKSIDEASTADQLPQDSHNLPADRALSNLDQRHRFVLVATYEFPKSKVKAFNGWEVSGIYRAASGMPLNAQISSDNSGTGTFSDRPNQINRDGRVFASEAFQIPVRGSFGNAGRNTLVGPHLSNGDVAIIKKTYFGNDRGFELRADVFDILNHPNFAAPKTVIDEPSFGQVNATRVGFGHRRIQVGIKLLF